MEGPTDNSRKNSHDKIRLKTNCRQEQPHKTESTDQTHNYTRHTYSRHAVGTKSSAARACGKATGRPKAFDSMDGRGGKPGLSHQRHGEWRTSAEGLASYITLYLKEFVRAISAANIPTSRVQEVLRPTLFAQKIAVDLSWLEQKWGIGLLTRLLPKEADHTRVAPISMALCWIRKLEGRSAAEAARKAGLPPEECVDKMNRWEKGRQKARRDSFALIKQLYGMNEEPRYRFWFWIALVLDAAGSDFRQEIAACMGRGFDLTRPSIPLSCSPTVT
jgi:hypothetical protein